MSAITIFHNPRCGTSRNVLALIRNSGVEPEVIEYLKTPPSRERLRELLATMGVGVRAVLRQKGTRARACVGLRRWCSTSCPTRSAAPSARKTASR